jgi:DNA-binding GntR family transcriptional regulator
VDPADTVPVERPPLIGDTVLGWIRDAIVAKDLAPGARLSEAALATKLGVSKTPVREALLRLRAIGLVTAADGSLRVVLPSPRLVREAYEIRASLEAMAAELSAARADDDAVAAIRAAARDSHASAEDDDLDGFRRQDRRFHELVVAASGNNLAREHVMNARDLCQALRQRDVMTDHVSRVCGQAHLAIADAIAAGDSVGARRHMSEHIHYVKDRVLGSMDTTDTFA